MSFFIAAFLAVLGALAAVSAAPAIFAGALVAVKGLGIVIVVIIVAVAAWLRRR